MRALILDRTKCCQGPVTLQPQCSLLSHEIEWEVVPAALHNKIGLLPWSPLAGGFLSGKYQRGGTAPPGTRAGSEKPLYQWISEGYANSDPNWATIETVVRIAKEIGATPVQVPLSWIAARPGVIAPIVGARTVEHLRNNPGAAELTLDNEATGALETISAPQSGGYPMEPLAQVSVRVGYRMGRRLPSSLTQRAPIILPDA